MLGTILWTAFGVLIFLLIAIKFSWLKGTSTCGRVKCTPQFYIRGPKNLIFDAAANHVLKREGNTYDKAKIGQVLALIEAYINAKYAKEETALCNDYETFDPMLHHSVNAAKPAEGGDEKPAEESAAEKEKRFFDKLMPMLDKAGFKALTKKEVEFAQKEEYLLTVPIQVSWQNFDTEMITSVYKDHEGQGNFENNDKIMIFHRGVTLDVTKGLLIWEKIDVLTTFLLGWIVKLFKPATSAIMGSSGSGASAEASMATLDMTESFEDKIYKPSQEEIKSKTAVIDRVRLDEGILNPTAFMGISQVQEPAFEEVFVLWRGKHKSDSVNSLSISGLADNIPADAATTPKYIFTRYMRGIPLADLELIYPEKRIIMKPFDTMLMVSSIVLALMAIFVELFSDSESSMTSIIIVGSLGLLAKVIGSYFASMSFYNSVILGSMNNRTLGNNRCSIQHLVDSVKAQEIKEAVIAWCALAGANEARALPPSKISAEANKIIDAFDFDRSVNPVRCILDTEGALKLLLDLKLAKVDPSNVTATTPDEAIGLLREAISAEVEKQNN